MRCQVVIPGIGQCELEDDWQAHKPNSLGMVTHVVGPVTWNGGPVIEVDDAALDAARRDRQDVIYCLPCDKEYVGGGCPVHP